MEWPIVECDADRARALIARCWLTQSSRPVTEQLGEITLRRHQISAVERINRAIDQFGGALLCDEVGLGKTYVALAVAKQHGEIVVVAPAVLRSMWATASRSAGVAVRFVSFESLSRGANVDAVCRFLIVDEAHHARNSKTRRYAALSQIARNRPVILLSATPIHNRRRDLTALLALFLGSRAESLDAAELSRCIVRRTVQSARDVVSFPRVADTISIEATGDESIAAKLLALPPAVPPRDGGEANTLVIRSLVRQWASSDDALIAALKRRIRRGSALAAALEEGTYPSGIELGSWIQGEDVQLGFFTLLAPPTQDAERLLVTIRVHEEALREVLADATRSRQRTRTTSDTIQSIQAAHPAERIVAFSQYADTIAGLYREMRGRPHVCAITGKGATIASGRIEQDEALRRFAPRGSGVRPSKNIERIDLLLATDLLSEGVNLQDASVVIHLDMPWTPARLEQRLGRVARMGSTYDRVASYAFAPPPFAERLLGLSATLERKGEIVGREVGGTSPVLTRGPSVPEAIEAIRVELMKWESDVTVPVHATCAAAVATSVDGFVALEEWSAGFELIVCDADGTSTDPRRVLTVLRFAGGSSIPLPVAVADNALDNLELRSLRLRALSPAGDRYGAAVRRAASRRLAKVKAASGGHLRLTRLQTMERAWQAISGPMDAATEQALAALVDTPGDNEYIEAVAVLPRRKPSSEDSTARVRRIVALLLLVRT